MKYNNELNKIDNPDKAYLLGFMYGDGTITHYFEKNGRERHYTKLSIIDEELIKKLCNKFKFFNLNEFDYSKYNNNSKKQYSISKSSEELFNDLLKNGMYTNKSYENKDCLRMPNIVNDLKPHFIRGFFDADGSVYRRTCRNNLITIEFTSSSKLILINIDNYLKSKNIQSWKILEKKPTGKGVQKYYILQYIKTDEIIKLINLMYENASLYLQRKSDICLLYKPVNKVLDRKIECPACLSINTIKNGKRNNKARFKCKDCNKNFTQ